MNPKKKLRIVLVASLIILIGSVVITQSAKAGICSLSICGHTALFEYTIPLTYFFSIITSFMLLLFLAPNTVVDYWITRVLFLVPLFLVWIFASSDQCGVGCFLDRSWDARILAGIFVLISVFILTVKRIQWWVERRKRHEI